MFEVGDKVVCVVDFPAHGMWYRPKGLPVDGRVYVVTNVLESKAMTALQLIGLPVFYLHASGLHEVGWDSLGFRKLSDMQQAARARRKAGIGPEVGLFEPMTGWRKEIWM